MQQEDAYLKILTNATTYRMTDDRLEIEDGSGETTLIFAVKEKSAMDPSDLVGTQWQLISMNADGPVEGWTITLVFHDENQVSGSAGCRGYVGGYNASGDDISFPWLAMMGTACLEQEALMSQEGQYTDSLSWASDYRLGEGRLEILTARGETLTFEPLLEEVNASLERTRWVLTAFIEERAVEGMAMPLLMSTDLLAETEITATLEDGTVSGSAGCNTYFAAYTLDGTQLTFETPAATEMACLDPAGVMEQEQRYLNSLGDVAAHRIYSGQLWLETGDGSALVFAAADVSEP
jgi:heat shock protein HslJ